MIGEDLRKESIELQKQAAAKIAEAERLEKLQQLYPDLKRHVGRWNKVVYCSPSVNSLVTDYETRHNCGCCGDSPLELWPYLETEHGRIYSRPTGIFIGERDPYFGGDISRSGWREDLQKHGFPEGLIERVSYMFEDERRKALEAVEERYSEEGAPDEPEPLL